MNFKTVFKIPFSHAEILSLLRIFNGISLLIYFCVAIIPNWGEFFSTSGFVEPTSFVFYPKSWLFTLWDFEILKIFLFVISFVAALFYTFGLFAKISLLFLIPIQIGFHLASPMIIHEPQQLTNLLMVLLLFMPIEDAFVLKKGPSFLRPLRPGHVRFLIFTFLAYLSLYYFFAGLKKLPDHFWLEGRAVGLLASWPFLSHDNIFNKWVRLEPVSLLFSYLTLLFEMGFIALAFTRFKRWLIIPGICFHFGISVVLDVGLFFWAMIQWYPLLLISKDLNTSESLDYPSSK